ncbi:MAG TPA: ribulokinase [Aggregatilinea sp.]|uniref:ribulokinase n=1 Tax=Aggregatilinea sp. TaxID=2806333 RepID=UPI002D0AEF75|nr:ribulokinase [Aggregatilinea sp.]HML23463.1 ribulokinase [Aggregatilinea sp.]
MAEQYAVGVDFGTESGRAVVVRVSDGAELGSAVHKYVDGVIDEHLPGSDKPLPPEWALQNPDDYIAVFKNAVPAAVKAAGIDPADVIGIGIDFTACTILPVKADGTPLMRLPELRDNPHAWVKLWKHHAAQPEADKINETAREMGEPWLNRYGGKISSEWLFSKTLQILDEAPEVYAAADRILEAADWVVWQLGGQETRNACTAGYKAIYQDGDYPQREYFAALDPRLADVVDTKLKRELSPLGGRAGNLTEEAAGWTGLKPGIAVAVANVDAHVTPPAAGVVGSGVMVMIMGTSTCHMVIGDELHEVPGMCGVVDGGIVPGLYGYEAGQSGVGDIFAWFVDNAVPPEYHEAAQAKGMDLHAYLEMEAAKQKPGEHGLLALDWWNGNRSVLVDVDLSGLLIGATLATKAPDIYRALIEATAFGTRTIMEAFDSNGVPINEVVAAGGLPEKNKLLMQIYADVTGREFKIIKSGQGPAVGSAMHAAVAAGVYENIQAAAAKMGALKDETFKPIPENQAVYDKLYAEYVKLHDYFGRGENDVMKHLRQIRNAARGID